MSRCRHPSLANARTAPSFQQEVVSPSTQHGDTGPREQWAVLHKCQDLSLQERGDHGHGRHSSLLAWPVSPRDPTAAAPAWRSQMSSIFSGTRGQSCFEVVQSPGIHCLVWRRRKQK